jgi:ribosomal protein S18 acetylase RimI-like enzyme
MQESIRRILADESVAVVDLRLRARKEYPNFFGTTYDEEAARSVAALKAELVESNVYGAWQGQKLIAIAGYFSSPLSKLNHKASLYGLYTCLNMRRRGTMMALLLRMIDEMPMKITVLMASVARDNIAAQNMLRRLGFATLTIEPRAMRDETGVYHDLVLMRLDREMLAHS